MLHKKGRQTARPVVEHVSIFADIDEEEGSELQ
jgi:hypothetical protein